MQQYLGETGGRERVRLVLNRFRKIAGFSEADAEAAAGAKLLVEDSQPVFRGFRRHRSRSSRHATGSHRNGPFFFRTGGAV